MAIVVVTPLDGEPFGPGFRVEANSDVIGPFEPGGYWQIKLDSSPAEEPLGSMIVPLSDHTVSAIFTDQTFGLTAPVPGQPNWITGETADLTIRRFNPANELQEQLVVPIILDRQTGQVAELVEWLKSHMPAAGTGLSETEHNAVLQTNVGVIALSSLNPLDMVGDLAAALSSSPPLGFGGLSTTYTLSGDGEMPDIGDLFHTKLGIFFVAVTIPGGLGHRHGQSEEYPSRLVQWRTVHQVGGSDMVTEVVDFETHGELWQWRRGKPSRIEYSILPGVVLHAQWWQFP